MNCPLCNGPCVKVIRTRNFATAAGSVAVTFVDFRCKDCGEEGEWKDDETSAE